MDTIFDKPLNKELNDKPDYATEMPMSDSDSTSVSQAIATLNTKFVYVSISNSDGASAKFTSALTTISVRNYEEDKSYPVMMFFSGSNFVGAFTGTINVTSGGIRFAVSDETRIYQGLFLRSNNTISSISNHTYGTGSKGIEFRNTANCFTIIGTGTPSSGSPSVWMDINPDTKKLIFYKDIGSGWVQVGTINIT